MSVTVRSFEPASNIKLIGATLKHVAVGLPAAAFVCVGDTIDTDEQEGFLRGHGTQVLDGHLVATVCGVVERVNRLVYVKPLKSRYSAELGDVVVGRVTEVAGKRWKIDLNSRQEAALLLSAVNLPGGIQRRRNAEDELNMRSVFQEGDLISAEVQSLHHDGSVVLHTRSLKYGKLTGGQLVAVPANLVKRQKQHFRTLESLGVDVILGLNGLIWVAPHVERGEGGAPLPTANIAGFSAAQREATCRVSNAIRALAALCLQIYPSTIMDAYELCVQNKIHPKDMLEMEFLTLVAQSEVVRRHNEAAAM
eukprot:jgi/Chrzof1/10103/Cz04g27050.t1